MMMIPKWGNYPGDGGGGITLVIDIAAQINLSSPRSLVSVVMVVCLSVHSLAYARPFLGPHLKSELL